MAADNSDFFKTPFTKKHKTKSSQYNLFQNHWYPLYFKSQINAKNIVLKQVRIIYHNISVLIYISLVIK